MVLILYNVLVVSLPGYTWLCGLKYTGSKSQSLQDNDFVIRK